MRPVTSRTKTLLLGLIAVGWLILSVANFVKGHPALGALYLVLSLTSAAIARSVTSGRRAR